jgi:NADH:ubiquinone oxidoreductase subunit F (NADH-binding)
MTSANALLSPARPPEGAHRLLSAASPDYAAHLDRFGGLPQSRNHDGLISQLEAAGLEGRGGAAFPTWRKLKASLDARGANAVVIANGAEGEPASAKDGVLLDTAPHLVLDGLLLCASVVGARDVYLYVRRDQLASVRRAIGERRDARGIVVREAPGTFVSGEASAVVNGIENRVAVPRDHPVRLAIAGVRGRPTVVHNVETLAHVALIARFGSAWFRSVGSKTEPGTRLVTVSSERSTRAVVEVAGGSVIRDIISAAGRDPSDVDAVLVGGYHGAWLPGTQLDTALTRDALQPYGGSPGAGVLFILPRGRCGLRASSRIASYLASQSAGQCGPCVNGLPAIASVLTRLATDGREARLTREIRELTELVQGRGSCHHPDGTAQFVLSTLNSFGSEVSEHAHGRCREDAA